ncbi:DNA polymerase-like protein PA0670 [Pseudonocardia sp. N23]|nr:DNA polymerase-like protein PA0670 [Pseudonocardia sp. N23]
MRVLALWSPDWPVTAAARAEGVPSHRPAAVVVGNRVLACSATARTHGVRRGLRRREAQSRCPELAVLGRDPERDARLFEPVVVAVEELAPGVEVVRPGLVALPARGPAGFFGGELGAAERLVDRVAARTGVECQVGVADGLFAAVLAARRGVAVEAGATPAFLAAMDVVELDREPEVDRSELVGLLRRLGLRSLGAFGSLDAADVASRFGADAVLAHRLARGLDPRPPVRRCPPEELAVELELDPPVDRVDAAAFAARGLAERLHRVLAGHGLSCTRLGVAATTEQGEELLRIWRCAEPLTPSGTVDRVRWQLDAWLTRGGSGAVVRMRLTPEETVTAGALQLGLWGEVGVADERAGRALVRVQALLGPGGVVTAVLTGGRDPAERVRLVSWGDARATLDGVSDDRAGPMSGEPPAAEPGPSEPGGGPAARPGRTGSAGPGRSREPGPGVQPPLSPAGPMRRNARRGTRRTKPVRAARPGLLSPAPVWPGRLPAPSPASVLPEPRHAVLLDAAGAPVGLRAADLLDAVPARLDTSGGPSGAVVGWAGPWPVQQRWWVPGAVSTARLQVVLDDGVAVLLVAARGRWWLAAVYD